MALDTFYFCYVKGQGVLQHIHMSLEMATGEAKRLARVPENYGKKVFILQPVGYYEAIERPVEWYEV